MDYKEDKLLSETRANEGCPERLCRRTNLVVALYREKNLLSAFTTAAFNYAIYYYLLLLLLITTIIHSLMRNLLCTSNNISSGEMAGWFSQGVEGRGSVLHGIAALGKRSVKGK